MRQLKNILLATDFTPASDSAHQLAIRLAWTFGSKVTPLHVVEPVHGMPKLQAHLHEQMSVVTRSFTEELTAKCVEVFDASTVVGRPAAEILKKAEETDADLIVIGAGKRGKVAGFQIGPIAEAVIQKSVVPVLACRPDMPSPMFHSIVCPIDQSETSRHALLNAIRLAKTFQSKLFVVTVFAELEWMTGPTPTGELVVSLETMSASWKAEFDAFLESTDFEGVMWEKEIRTGRPSEEIVAACRDHQADVLVMGSHGRNALGNFLLGSMTARVLHQLPCSILTVKHQDILDDSREEEGRIIRMLYAAGNELFEEKDYASALVKFRHVLARDPFHAGALRKAALACDATGDTNKSRQYRRMAEQLDLAQREAIALP